jgi:hypothetical protein
MEKEILSRKVSKIDIAMIQLNAAIRANMQNRDIEAITLAGAAEEIFGAMCRRRGLQNAVKKIAELEITSWNSDDVKNRISCLNKVRNNLKHADNEAEDEFEVTELDPIIMIVRAIENARILEIEFSQEMELFCTHHKIKN